MLLRVEARARAPASAWACPVAQVSGGHAANVAANETVATAFHQKFEQRSLRCHRRIESSLRGNPYVALTRIYSPPRLESRVCSLLESARCNRSRWVKPKLRFGFRRASRVWLIACP